VIPLITADVRTPSPIGLPSIAFEISLVPEPAATPATTSVPIPTPIFAPVVTSIPEVAI
jgi:hypothetical protein